MKTINKISKRPIIALAALLMAVSLLAFGTMYHVSAQTNKSIVTDQVRCGGTCIDLRKDDSSPTTVTVIKDSYVQFNSADGKTHNLSLGEGGAEHDHKGIFRSGNFGADEAWRVQFDDEGTFIFHDHLNPKISILVVVYTPGKDYKVN